MDELLYDGFWLETTDASNFWNSDLNPTSEANNNTNPHNAIFLKETSISSTFGEPALSNNYLQMDEFPENVTIEESQVNSRRLWVGPNRTNPVSVKKRLLQAINGLKDSIRDKDVLIQIWIPVKRGSRQVLTTNNQPFSLNPNCKNLQEYRDVSRSYQFAADVESNKELVVGLPGRVFLNKLPEWTPDVRFFRTEEYPRVSHAQRYHVRGSLALPVFEQGSGVCLGVVEVVTTSRNVDFTPELEYICKALEAVDLKSCNIRNPNGERGASGGDLDDEKHKGKAVAVSLTNHEAAANLKHENLEQNFELEGSENFSLTIGDDTSLVGKKSGEKRRTKTEKTISLRELRQHFSGSLKEAAKSIGVCPTTLKRICRQHGISRWPSRKIKKVSHSLKKLQLVIDSVQGAEGSIQLTSFYNNYPNLVPPKNQPDGNNNLLISPSKSPASSGSTSSLSCSQASSVLISGDALSPEKNGVMMLKSDKGHKISSEEAPAVLTFRVKVAFGEEKIRFSLQPQWGFRELREEVLRRFNIINNGNSVSLKYLDDDAEWVLLTCDADLEECTYVHRSSNNPVIKLAVNQASHRNLASKFIS